MKYKKLYSYLLTFLLALSLFPKQLASSASYGFIYGAVTGVCVSGVTITIKGVSPTTGIWTLTTNPNGTYYSSSTTSNCALPCPGVYTVTASKPGAACEFSGPVTIELKNCCGTANSYYQANFKSTSTEKKNGIIYGAVTGAVVAGVTITIEAVSPATGKWTATTDVNGKYYSSSSTACVLPCPGKYKVSASKTGSYAFSEPVLVELTTCCGSGGSQANFKSTSTEKKNGIISGTVGGAIKAGVTVIIEGISPTTGSWKVTTDINGKYYSSGSTSCILPCPGKYKVTASKTGYTFSAPVTVELKTCCGSGEYGLANFTATAEVKKYGLIYGYVTGAVVAGVTITITALSPATGTWTVTTDANGKYQSSTSTSINCALPCPGKYKVTASKTGSYAFSEPVLVELTTCCGSGGSQANFKSTSTEKKNGIIYGAVTGAVVAGVTITIEAVSPATGKWTATTDVNGKYYSSSSTACVLPCPGKYKVSASKTGSYAFSEPVLVELTTCCGSGGSQANFKSTSTEKKNGIIYGYVSGSCIEDVTIIINGIYPSEGQWVFKTDKNGKYSTTLSSECLLPCPGKYIVMASKPNSACKFSDPVIVELKTCCGSGEYGRADFKTEPMEPKGRIIGNVMGSKTPVTISIIQEGGGQGWVFQTDALGFYDTGCVIPCPGSYLVIPSVPGSDYSFTPPYQNVKLEKCCINGYLRVDFQRTYSTKNQPLLMWYLTNNTKSMNNRPF